jgi:1-deoxy-D-xylulose-5-phosphate synthase
MQRAYDNVIHDVAIKNLPVVICLDRAGLVGEDGVTHHGAFDLAYLRTIPNIVIAAPADEADLKDLMFTALHHGAPFVIRYPRGSGPGTDWSGDFTRLDIGRGRVLTEGTDVALLTIGATTDDGAKAAAKAAAEGISVQHIDLRFAKPLDEELLHSVGRNFSRVITVEDGALDGGVGSAVLEFFATHGYSPQVHRLGLPDHLIEHGTVPQLRHLCGYDVEGIYNALKA